MSFASLIVTPSAWWFAAGASLTIAFAFAAWSYRTAPRGPLRTLGMLLRTAAVLVLAFCLLEPLWTRQRARPGANLFALVADNSQGLQVKDGSDASTRGEQLRHWLTSDPGTWQQTLEHDFEVRRFLFDTRLHSTRDYHELTFDGRATAIGGALRELGTRFAGRPLAGVLLLTDGNATDLRDPLPDWTGLPPVYPVVLGRPGAVTDIALDRVQVTESVFEDAPVTIQAEVAATGFSGEPLVAQVVDASGQRVQQQTLQPRRRDDVQSVRLQLRPQKSGLSFYELRVGPASEMSTNTSPSPSPSREATTLNNHRILAVQHGHGPYRILYVSGRPNWEYKFLQRAAKVDDQLQLVALIRVALREPKFQFRGRAGETGNPLFRGFGDQSREEVERYDQPVLMRLNTRDDLELRAGFPRTPEDLYEYHAVILDDIEAAFFSPDQSTVLQRFVSERGGGFLMLGGMECFQQGVYDRTPIGDMLPVYLDRAADPQGARGPVHFQLSREGWLQPWARLHENEGAEKDRLVSMPPFDTFNPVREVKPGASVMASATDAAGREFPALVTQRFGRGRTAALMIGDMWRWGMRNPEAHRDMDKSWRQLLRWLVADVPRRVEVAVEPASGALSTAVQLQVRVRDEKFQPADDAAVYLTVQPVMTGLAGELTNSVRLRAEASPTEPGLYETTYAAQWTGGYRVEALVTNASGASLGSAEAGWSADLAADEFRSLQPNLPLLETLARRTGGKVLQLDQLESFVRDLPQRSAPVMEASTEPAWHSPALFAFALTCLIVEWGLRRWRGLP